MTTKKLKKTQKTPPRRPLPLFCSGDLVSYHGGSRKEYGRVIYSYWHRVLGCWDVYVAFHGYQLPSIDRAPREAPYVLRYLETSLERA